MSQTAQNYPFIFPRLRSFCLPLGSTQPPTTFASGGFQKNPNIQNAHEPLNTEAIIFVQGGSWVKQYADRLIPQVETTPGRRFAGHHASPVRLSKELCKRATHEYHCRRTNTSRKDKYIIHDKRGFGNAFLQSLSTGEIVTLQVDDPSLNSQREDFELLLIREDLSSTSIWWSIPIFIPGLTLLHKHTISEGIYFPAIPKAAFQLVIVNNAAEPRHLFTTVDGNAVCCRHWFFKSKQQLAIVGFYTGNDSRDVAQFMFAESTEVTEGGQPDDVSSMHGTIVVESCEALKEYDPLRGHGRQHSLRETYAIGAGKIAPRKIMSDCKDPREVSIIAGEILYKEQRWPPSPMYLGKIIETSTVRYLSPAWLARCKSVVDATPGMASGDRQGDEDDDEDTVIVRETKQPARASTSYILCSSDDEKSIPFANEARKRRAKHARPPEASTVVVEYFSTKEAAADGSRPTCAVEVEGSPALSLAKFKNITREALDAALIAEDQNHDISSCKLVWRYKTRTNIHVSLLDEEGLKRMLANSRSVVVYPAK